MSSATANHHGYYTPSPSPYPIILSVSLLLLAIGGVLAINSMHASIYFALLGGAIMIVVLFGWFGTVISENRRGLYLAQEDRSFRMGMIWLITSEVVFFSSLFGVLFYERNIAVPWLSSLDPLYSQWHHFVDVWPTSGPAGKPFQTMHAMGIAAINTVILLSSGATITWAHWGVRCGKQGQTKLGLFLTIALGVIFLFMQAHEFHEAYAEMGLTLHSGVYGATFFILTGFHGLHVTLGVIMLTVIFFRALKGHFTQDNHFAFEAVSWYWHFVDVVWLALFIFVYWL
jgi:cytochrome c oxidase subunit 3